MYYYLIILITICISYSAHLKGRVIDIVGEPIFNVNIELINHQIGTSTDRDGYFLIKDIPSNEYSLKISHIGFQEKIVESNNFVNQDFVITLYKEIKKLDDVVITGQRREVYIKDSPILTRVITSEDIKSSAYSSVKDVLEMAMPNIQNVISSHAGISNNNVKIQGLDNKFILFLIDGSRVTGEFAGNLDFNMLNLSNVERIEVVDGGLSSIYGSDAIGGVVNIVTKENLKPFKINFSYLSERPYILSKSLNIGFKHKNFSYDIGFVNQETDGYDLTLPDAEEPPYNNGILDKTQEAYSNRTISNKLKYNFKINNSYNGELSFKHKKYINTIYKYETHLVMVPIDIPHDTGSYFYTSYANDSPRFKNDSYDLIFQFYQKSSNFKIKYHKENYKKYNYLFNYHELACDQYGFDCNQSNDLVEAELLNANNENQSLSIQYNFLYKNHDFIIGFEGNDDEYSSYNTYFYDADDSGDCTNGIPPFIDCWSQSIFNNDATKYYKKRAVFIGDEITFENNNKLNISIRNTDSNNFGSGLVSSLSYINKTLDPYSFRFNYSRGFRTPSIKELYYTFLSHPPPIYGNTNLKATTNDYVSFSMGNRKIDRNFSIELFYNNVVDMIGTVSATDDLGEEFLQYENYKDVSFSGINLHYEKIFDNKDRLRFFYNYTLPESDFNSALELISKYSARLHYSKSITNTIQIMTNIKYLSSKDIYLGNQKVELDEYVMMDLMGRLQIGDSMNLKMGWKNLLDYKDERRFLDNYSYILSSYDPGRRFFIEVSFDY